MLRVALSPAARREKLPLGSVNLIYWMALAYCHTKRRDQCQGKKTGELEMEFPRCDVKAGVIRKGLQSVLQIRLCDMVREAPVAAQPACCQVTNCVKNTPRTGQAEAVSLLAPLDL